MFQSIKRIFHTHDKTLDIGFIPLDDRYTDFIEKIAREFERHHPEIDINLFSFEDAELKSNINSWLDSDNCPDIVFWHGGQRFTQCVSSGNVACISKLWMERAWYEKMVPQTHRLVELDGDMWGVPIYSYHWGFYYRKSVFKHLGIDVPDRWSDFLDVCSTLKDAGIRPISIGLMDEWVSGSWFDYFNIRLNGYDFHTALLAGEYSFLDEKVKVVFEHWKTLIDREYFTHSPDVVNWSGMFDPVVQGKAGCTLVGSYLYYYLPKWAREDIGFFRFPILDDNVSLNEEFPVDIAFITSKSKNKTLAKEFLHALVSEKTQEIMHDKLGTMPVLKSLRLEDSISVKVEELWCRLENHSQFFDRDTNQKFAAEAMAAFAKFFDTADIDKTLNALECAREKYLLVK